MGLLDMAAPQQAQPQQQMGGLLGGMQAGGAPASDGGFHPSSLQLAQQLAQNPTPQMAQQVIQQLHQTGRPETKQVEQIISQFMNDPQALKQYAESVVQKLSGGQ